MPKGDPVLVRTSRGRPAVRRIWEAKPQEVVVVHDDYYRRWEQHGVTPMPFTIPVNQVFQHDPSLVTQLEEVFHRVRRGEAEASTELETLWGRTRPYAS